MTEILRYLWYIHAPSPNYEMSIIYIHKREIHISTTVRCHHESIRVKNVNTNDSKTPARMKQMNLLVGIQN